MSKDLIDAGHGFFRGCFLGATAVLVVVAGGCATSAHTFRLNPEQEPEQYRVTCHKRFYYCEAEAKEQCGGEYHELGRISNRPEQTLVKDSDVSSTGPAKGQGAWEGELTIECGRALPSLELKRPAGEVVAEPAPVAAPAVERVCIPGTTQACLGPGACSGAQACLESGSGFGACDCGPNPNVQSSPAPATPTTSATPSAAPTPAPAVAPVPSTSVPPASPAAR